MSAVAALSFLLAVVTLSFGSVRASRVLSLSLELPPVARAALAMALGTSIFLLAVALAGRVTGSFDAGLIAAAVAGAALAYFLRRPAALPVHHPSVAQLPLFLVLTGVLLLYAYLSARYQMHDEFAIFGHKSMVENLRSGVYPPYAPPLPDVEARYHYGFDVIAGALARAFDLSSDLSIDLATVYFAIFMSIAAAGFAAEQGAPRAASFAAAGIHLGGGLATFLLAGVAGRHPRCLIQYHHPSCSVELFPAQLLNVFQHPVSAGVPLALVFAFLAPKLISPAAEKSCARAAAIAVLLILPALALSQIVYFGLTCAGFLTVIYFIAKDRIPAGVTKKKPILFSLSILFAGLVLAVLCGGMFAPNPYIESGLVAFRKIPGFPPNEGPVKILWHHAVNLGLLFLLMPWFAWYLLRRERRLGALILLSASFGGILAAHLLVYIRSWDIVKFPSASSFFLVVIYAVAVDDLLALRSQPWGWIRRTGQALVFGTGIVSALYLIFPIKKDVRPYELGSWTVDPLVKKAVDWLRTHEWDHRELVYAQSNVAQDLAVAGGISVVAQDADLYYLGVRNELLGQQQRRAQELKSTMSKDALAALKVGWVVLSDEEIDNLGPLAKKALEDRARFTVAAEFPGENARRRRRIFRVVTP
jgi:hypothetical protein